jgi:Fe-S cluster biogenesis protein NfuA
MASATSRSTRSLVRPMNPLMANAQPEQAWDTPPPKREIVEAWLDRVRPALVADGGNLELISVDHDGTVRIALQGACIECPAQLSTVRIGIEEPLKKAIPGIQSVLVVDESAA